MHLIMEGGSCVSLTPENHWLNRKPNKFKKFKSFIFYHFSCKTAYKVALGLSLCLKICEKLHLAVPRSIAIALGDTASVPGACAHHPWEETLLFYSVLVSFNLDFKCKAYGTFICHPSCSISHPRDSP